MRVGSVVLAVSLFGLGCSTAKPAGPAQPDLSPAPAGTLTVGLGSGSGDVAAQAKALADWVAQATGHATRPAVFPCLRRTQLPVRRTVKLSG